MPLVVAVLDSDILIPIVACDFLLTAADLQVFEPIVSATVLEEVQRNLLEDFPHLDPSALMRRVGYMRAALADQIIDTQSGEDGLEPVNEKDRHVVAAAVISAASTVVTNDRALRAEIAASSLDLAALDGDTFVMGLWDESPDDVRAVVDVLIAKRRSQPVSPTERAGQLAVHFPSMTEAWMSERDRSS